MFLCFHLLYFLWCVQPLMQNSMVYGDFMASAHTSVNVLSAKYNHNKRQYNYTTTNNFLEQIRLYDILLDKKKNPQEAVMAHGGLGKWHADAFFRKKGGSGFPDKLWKSQPFISFFINNLCFIANHHHHLFNRLICCGVAFLCSIETA